MSKRLAYLEKATAAGATREFPTSPPSLVSTTGANRCNVPLVGRRGPHPVTGLRQRRAQQAAQRCLIVDEQNFSGHGVRRPRRARTRS